MEIRGYVWGLPKQRSNIPEMHYSPYAVNPNKGFSFLETLFCVSDGSSLGSGFRFGASGFSGPGLVLCLGYRRYSGLMECQASFSLGT